VIVNILNTMTEETNTVVVEPTVPTIEVDVEVTEDTEVEVTVEA
jgi:hypothetical protein